ncbi:MAG: beta-hexosaminidase [Bacilli bacterium]|jgi:beta-N-acetylhexosaminidase|nr:beta-hexosaminidase [Bacilli bacterium]
MVDLSKKPFNLTKEQIKWVEDTIKGMTLDEKIGQLFIHLTGSVEEKDVKEDVQACKMGGIRFNPGPKERVWEMNYNFDKFSKIPVLSAVNAEMGGNGAAKDGTFVGSEMKIAATKDPHYAYELGRIAGLETRAVGSNWTFAPVTDLVLNWHHPGIATRGWGADPELVLKFSKEYIRGAHESHIACTMKHFPGDATDERDPHIATSVNSLSCEEWDKSFGKVYKGLIEAGIEAVMPGHIIMPAYERYFNKGLKDEDLKPATISKELLTDLLRNKLGFNGVIVSDASHMVGVAGRAKRSDLVPGAIIAGCDMFLFFNNIEEDTQYMKDAVLDGRLTQERLNEALTRILGLKAHVGLADFTLDKFPPKEGLAVVGAKENAGVAQEVSDKGITLVKHTENILPITAAKYKKILLVPVGPHPDPFLVGAGMAVDGSKLTENLKARLEALGHKVEIYVDPIAKMKQMMQQMGPDAFANMMKSGQMAGGSKGMYGMKQSVHALTDNYDLVICFANVSGTMRTTQRLEWAISKGGWDNPWYVNELPTIFVSFNCPFHLADVSQVKTFINCYDSHETTIAALIDKLEGKSEFKGVSPVDAFCGLLDTHF